MEIKFAYKVWSGVIWDVRSGTRPMQIIFLNDVGKGEGRVGETERREIKRRFLT
jgi:hypothetical protein